MTFDIYLHKYIKIVSKIEVILSLAKRSFKTLSRKTGNNLDLILFLGLLNKIRSY